MRRTSGPLALAALPLLASTALARTPPVAPDPREGVWLGSGELFIHQSRDRWSVFSAGSAVNKLVADEQLVWIATDDGAIRLDSGTRRSGALGMEDGLPSQAVSAVAADDQYVWFATNKGVARYRKLDRTLRVYTDEDGLPHRAVADALAIGRQIWFATRGGLAVYDRETDGLRAFTTADGLASDDVQELYQVGDDLWCRTDAGLTRLRIKNRVFTSFSFQEIGGEELRAFTLDGDRIWVGTENGLFSFEPSSDSFIPFPQQSSLQGKSIAGVETFGDYLFIATDRELVQFHKLNRSIRRFTEAEGLRRQEDALGTLLSGGLYTVLFADGVEVYEIQREQWSSRSLAPTAGAQKARSWRLSGKLNGQEPLDLGTMTLGEQRFATSEGGLGYGERYAEGRSLDLSMALDYGQLELAGIRDLQVKGEYAGAVSDLLREIRVEDKLKYRGVEEGLERPLLLQGGTARVASRGEKPKAALKVDAGLRRGASMREFLTGPRKEIYPLAKRYILPGSEQVWVDGELLTNGTDYTIIYPAGQLAFLDPERADDLSIIEVEYEYDLMPKKGLGVLSLVDLLPADKEVGDWTRAGEARLISEETGLYAQIDGAAPKYIDRGWVRSVYAEYRQGSRTIQVALHDIGTDANAESLYQFDLPQAREAVEGHDTLVLDVGLPSSYAAKARAQSYYVELSIDEKSDVAKQSLKLFAIQILDRGTNAGALDAEAVRETLASVRGAWSPVDGAELGTRVLSLNGFGPAGSTTTPRQLLHAIADGRYEREIGEGGRLTAYGELAGTHEVEPGGSYGFAAMGKLRFSHPWIEGTLTAQHDSPGYSPLGSDATLYGRLRDSARLAATAYPTRWLPVTAFFTRELSELDGGGSGVVQQASGRVQLSREGLPGLSLQMGHTFLDSAAGTTNRLKLVAQGDYDFVQGPLAFTGMKRFAVRALYSASQAVTDLGGLAGPADRTQLARIEAKVAPTATESAYALFRSRSVTREQTIGQGNFGVRALHWELNSGARSAIVPGLIPEASYAVIFDDDRLGTSPARTSKGSLAGALGIYPGQWLSALAPLVLLTRYSLASDEAAEGELKTLWRRLHRVDNRIIWAGGGAFELELIELWEMGQAGAGRHLDGRKLELRNRIVWRPLYTSPITLRLNYQGQQLLNDLTLAPSAPAWARQASYEGVLEWLMRWTRALTTKVRGGYTLGTTEGKVAFDAVTRAASVQSFLQHQVALEAEVRVFPFDDASRLFLVQRDRVYRTFAQGAGAGEELGFDVAAGVIWTLGDNLYLDSDVTFRKTRCIAQPCTPVQSLEPRMFLTFNL